MFDLRRSAMSAASRPQSGAGVHVLDDRQAVARRTFDDQLAIYIRKGNRVLF
jgi:hypothetical protein